MNNKSFKIVILEKILRCMARVILWRHHPYIIGITGSVGKTTTKDCIVQILKNNKNIYYTKKNYNNEIGVPMTIIGIEQNIDSISSFAHIVMKWMQQLIKNDYPGILILEMGVDRPGDMDYFMSMMNLDISILTAVSYAHSEFFENIDEIIKEKQKIITKTRKENIAIVNYDDENIQKVIGNMNNRVITYSIEGKTDFVASDVEICFHKCHDTGLTFKLRYLGKIIPVRLEYVIAEHLIYSVLAGLAVAKELGINMIDAIDAISNFKTSPGRMTLLKGINNSTIIDDTYNASPKSMLAAMKTLKQVTVKKSIAVLGDMRELGNISQKEHEKIAKYLLKYNIDDAYLIGKNMKWTYDKLKNKKDISVNYYKEINDAIENIKYNIQSDDTILVKGSRSMHMEDIVKEII